MLFAVEGGGFFSSSASGYSSGLTLLLLGQKNEERPMRVSPWNQYHLVEQDLGPNVQLASSKDQASCGCASFICFSSVSAGLQGNSPPKVGPAQRTDCLKNAAPAETGKTSIKIEIEDGNGGKIYLKSSLKKNPVDHAPEVPGVIVANVATDEEKTDVPSCTDRRKVQWTDACGRELVEVREFELSDEGSSNEEIEQDGDRRCECVIQ